MGKLNPLLFNISSRRLVVLLCCAVLMLVWFASRFRVPLSLFTEYKPKSVVFGGEMRKQFVHAASVETDAEVVFHQDMLDYNTSRIPALIHHKNMFFAFCEGRRDTFRDIGEMEIILRRGTRRDWTVTWGPVQVLARMPGFRMMNPVPIVDTAIDMLLLVYNAHPFNISQWDELVADKYQQQLYVIKSFDLGETWTPPQDITEETVGNMRPVPTLYGPGPGHGIQLASGRLIIPISYFVKVYESDQQEFRNGTIKQANVLYSDDHGSTWSHGGSVPYGVDQTTGNAIQAGEPRVVEIDGKQICLNMRTLHADQPRVLSFSQDEGVSFTSGQLAWALEEPGYFPEENYTMQENPYRWEDNFSKPADAGGCQAGMLGFPAPHLQSPSRTWVVFSNPASPKFRVNMGVRISKDGCHTWSKPWTIHANASAYSDLAYFETWDSKARVRSPNIAILFEAGEEFSYETIQFKMFSLERLLQGIQLQASSLGSKTWGWDAPNIQ